jgi:hypothetical protein
MPGMKEAKSPAPAPVMVAMEPTSMGFDPLAPLEAVGVVVELEVVLGELEQAARTVPQARARMATAPRPRVGRPLREGLVGRGHGFVIRSPLLWRRRPVGVRPSTAWPGQPSILAASIPAFTQVKGS